MVIPAKTALAGAGVQGVAAVAVVAALVTAGVVTLTNDGPSATINVPAQSNSPAPAPELPSATEPSAEPTGEATVDPTGEPSREPPPGHASALVGATGIVSSPGDSPAPAIEPAPDPEPAPPVTAPTDLGIEAITITNDSPLWQRHITVPVSSHTVGRAKDLRVTLTLVFSKTVRFRGVVSQGWDCGDLIPNSRVKSMTCTRIQSGPDIPSLVFKAQGFRPGATVNVDAADNADPNPANNSAVFRARYWSHL